jgi:hypothetical protein
VTHINRKEMSTKSTVTDQDDPLVNRIVRAAQCEIGMKSPTISSTSSTKKVSTYDVGDSLSRNVKWEYMIPIAATPSAHICVSLIRTYPQHTTKLLYGVLITTFLTIQARLILMYDAGYPGYERPPQERKELPAFLKIFLF